MHTIFLSLTEVLEPMRLALLLVGVCAGLVIGVIPGLGGIFGMALLIPLTYHLDAYSAVALLLGMASVTATSDTIPAVLIGVPGTVGSMATVLDGHALAKQGQAGRALGAAYSASLIGGLFGALVLALCLPLLRPVVLMMRTPDFLAISLLGLSLVALLVGKDPLKGLAAAGIGVALSFVGVDDRTAAHRWTYGQIYLWEGLPLGAVFMGLFGLPEIASVLSRRAIAEGGVVAGGGMRDGLRDTLREWRLVLQCSGLGAAVGALPGLGLSVVSWIAYGFAARNPGPGPAFGAGNIRGVIGPESANNANEGGSLIPTIALGIPGGAGTAMLLGALIVHGLVPGPHMLGRDAPVTIAMIMCLALANVLGAGLCLVMSNPLARLARVSSKTIAPIALVFVVFGAYQTSSSLGDIAVLLGFGALGMAMKARGWPRPAFALGFVLGGLIERDFYLTWQISGWDGLTRPSMLLVAAVISVQLVRRLARARRQAGGAEAVTVDLPGALSVLALALFVLLGARTLPPEAALFPAIAGCFLLLPAVGMLIGAWRARGPAAPVAEPPESDEGPLFSLANGAIMALVLALLAGLYLAGPVISAGVLVAATMRLAGHETVRRAALTGAGVALLVYLVFDRLVAVPWPRDLLSAALSGLF